ncbi:translesion DNA synthesis-associated protein ImuA [Aliikangiella coralliicola]|uniref:Translesion DNA synthesis-associated protein ImuA n=1 Tax=Aliikangiella coralliicola TaxID=2592383 RepID=A0A545U8Q3_9GAMM|nr:translesion DNA synthesis-associated protein ImuA [Aliikangiella coralliicola]TQV85849.1 translesion DNA synthesis-associated protein ImuA [Aliikangiella coralliicola]
MSSPTISQLLQNDGIWQASQKNNLRLAMSTGYAELDRQLHYSGWPQGAISELLLSHNGIGEIRLLSPLLARLNQKPGYITWVNPPYLPYAPALVNQRLKLDKQVIVKTSTVQETIWAAQQAMASTASSAVLVWLPKKVLGNEIRKLSLAAKAGKCWGILLRHQSLSQQSSPATLRVILQVRQQKHLLSIIKQPGGWSGQQISLELFPERINWNPFDVKYWPVFSPEKPQVRTPQMEISPTAKQPQWLFELQQKSMCFSEAIIDKSQRTIRSVDRPKQPYH